MLELEDTLAPIQTAPQIDLITVTPCFRLKMVFPSLNCSLYSPLLALDSFGLLPTIKSTLPG